MPFACLFTRPAWSRVPVLIEGTLLALHRRTVRAALRAAGPGLPRPSLRWVLARDPAGKFKLQAFLCTDLSSIR